MIFVIFFLKKTSIQLFYVHLTWNHQSLINPNNSTSVIVRWIKIKVHMDILDYHEFYFNYVILYKFFRMFHVFIGFTRYENKAKHIAT